MCGICGMVQGKGSGSPEYSTLERMCGVMVHRGPDAEGYYIEGQAALGHRRLSIIDLETGDQPIYNEDRTVAVVLNGEIYNHRELRRELEGSGHRFATRSDTEVIPHLYEEHGVQALSFLRGMFAFALWDSREGRLLLARDRMGQKPLFYGLTGDGIVFASEIEAVLASRRVEYDLDYAALDAYLANQFIPAPMTIYKGVRKLLPAHMAVWENGELKETRYWAPPSETLDMEEEECAGRLMELISRAVEMRLMSDVPIGAFLSGGIDSSLIVALMARITGARIKTFSIGFADSSYNELPMAGRVARLFGTDAHERIVDYRLKDQLPELVRHFGEPFGDSSALPVYHLSQMTGERVKVALSGDGCDETLGGYRRYTAARLARYALLLPSALRGRFLAQFLKMLPEGTEYYAESFRKKLRLFAEFLRNLDEADFASWYVPFSRRERERLYLPETLARVKREDDEDPVGNWASGHRGPDRLAEMMRADLQFYLPDDILAKVDRMSMAHSLEVRSPFLDQEFQEFAAVIPPRLKVRGTRLKYILKHAAGELLPPDIIHRPKHGFQVPVGSWLRDELADYVRDKLHNNLKDFFRLEYIKELLYEHQVAKRRDHGQKLWTLLILALWLEGHSRD